MQPPSKTKVSIPDLPVPGVGKTGCTCFAVFHHSFLDVLLLPLPLLLPPLLLLPLLLLSSSSSSSSNICSITHSYYFLTPLNTSLSLLCWLLFLHLISKCGVPWTPLNFPFLFYSHFLFWTERLCLPSTPKFLY